MTQTLTLTKAEQFFYDNAGYCYMPNETPEQGHLTCAKRLAEAERFAKTSDWVFEIEPDNDADESFMDEESIEYQAEWRGTAWYCQLLIDGEVVQSLSSCFGHSDYKRVVKAELSLEQMGPEDFADFVPSGDIPYSISK